MIKTKLFLVLVFLISISTFSQSLNEYKYIIVPVEYKFQKKENSYDLNELVKFLFNKYGYTAILDSESYPADLALNPCLALTADLINKSSMLSTKMYFEMQDCHDKVVFTSELAISKEKDYKGAYYEVIREAFESIKALDYSYEPKASSTTPAVATTATVANTQVPADNKVASNQSTTTTQVTSTNKTSTTTINNPNTPVVAATVATPVVVNKTVDSSVLYAQAIANGYQLVDSSPKVVYIALATSSKDIFIIKDGSGIIYKSNGNWVAEYYEGEQLFSKVLNIKLMD